MRLTTALLLPLLALSGCGWIFADEDFRIAAPDGGGGMDAGTDAGTDGGTDAGAADAGPDDAGPPPADTGPDGPLPDAPLVCMMATLRPISDTFLDPTPCPFATNYGGTDWIAIGAGLSTDKSVGLFRFMLGPDLAGAFEAGRVMSVRLRLQVSTEGGMRAPGTLRVFPARNDWLEGNNSGFTGANWCRRTDDTMDFWGAEGAAGAADRAMASAGNADYPASIETDLLIDVDPEALETWISGAQITLLAGSSDAVFYAVSRESTADETTLEIEVCD
jgi:hypothetical protein